MTNKKAKGKRAKTRRSFSRKRKVKTTITKKLKEFNLNDVVQVQIDSSQHKGIPFRRFNGLVGKIIRKQGNAFIVGLKDGRKEKRIIASGVHLREIK